MIHTLRELFYARIVTETTSPASSQRTLELATAALLIEVSRADFEVQEEERQAIERALQKSFGLTPEETNGLVELAEQEVEQAVSLYEFTRLVDRGFDPEQKKHIVGLLWEIAFSDERLQDREEYLIRKIAKLLHVPHRDFIREKLRVREGAGG